MRKLTTVLFAVAFTLGLGAVAQAAPPVFNGTVLGNVLNVYNVKAAPYNAKCDGTTDDSSAIQSAINAAQTAGYGVVYIPGVCGVASTLNVTSSNVVLQGISSGFFQYPGSSLKWVGTCGSSSTILNFHPGGTRAIESVGIRDLYLDPNGTGSACAGIGVVTNSVFGGDWERLAFGPFTNIAWQWTTTSGLTGGGNDMHNLVKKVVFENYWNSGNGMVLTGNAPNSSDDVASNTFIEVYGAYYNGTLIDIGNSDHNQFLEVHGFGAPGGTGTGIKFDCGSRYDEVIGDSADTMSIGSATCTGGTVGSPATNNRAQFFDSSDFPGGPTTQSGASLNWTDQNGDEHIGGLVSASSNAGQLTCSLSASTTCLASHTVGSAVHQCTASIDYAGSVGNQTQYYPIMSKVVTGAITAYVNTTTALTGTVTIDYVCL